MCLALSEARSNIALQLTSGVLVVARDILHIRPLAAERERYAATILLSS
jgi:hypothetical protein